MIEKKQQVIFWNTISTRKKNMKKMDKNTVMSDIDTTFVRSVRNIGIF